MKHSIHTFVFLAVFLLSSCDDQDVKSILSEEENQFAQLLVQSEWLLDWAVILPVGETNAVFVQAQDCDKIPKAFTFEDVVGSYTLKLRNDGYIDAMKIYNCSTIEVRTLWEVQQEAASSYVSINPLMHGKNFLINELEPESKKIINVYQVVYFNDGVTEFEGNPVPQSRVHYMSFHVVYSTEQIGTNFRLDFKKKEGS